MKLIWIFASVAILAAAGAFWLLRARHPPVPPAVESEHGQGMDREMGFLLAMYNAPEGATPCESDYNAFRAGEAVLPPGEVVTPPKEEFLKKCTALPPILQNCLTPRYWRKHRADCDAVGPTMEEARRDLGFVKRR